LTRRQGSTATSGNPTAAMTSYLPTAGPTTSPGHDPSRSGEDGWYQQAEDEPADVSEERDAAPVRLGVEQAGAGLDELVQERLWNRITRGRRPPVTGLD
jgi:hypothetical protein